MTYFETTRGGHPIQGRSYEEILSLYRLKIDHIANNTDEFLKLKATELINRIIVDAITKQMLFHKFHQKIWMNVSVKSVNIVDDRIIATISNAYWADSGFDVALARETGTKDHMIRPKVKMFLSWITKGKRLFSKGHMVSGLKSLFIIQRTVRTNTPIVQEALKKEYIKWQDDIMKGF